MLKRLKPRHMDIIRRLLVSETPGEICLELGMSESYLSVLQIDPLFKEKLAEMQFDLDERFLDDRANAMQILEAGAVESARIVVTAANKGHMKDKDGNLKEVSVKNRLKSAWDVLDHTGNKAPEKKLVGHFDAAELVKEAYVRKYPKEGNGGDNGGNGGEPSKAPKQPHASSAFDNLNESSPEPVDGEVKLLTEGSEQMNLFEDADL